MAQIGSLTVDVKLALDEQTKVEIAAMIRDEVTRQMHLLRRGAPIVEIRKGERATILPGGV